LRKWSPCRKNWDFGYEHSHPQTGVEAEAY
jgi:hypothetical protein